MISMTYKGRRQVPPPWDFFSSKPQIFKQFPIFFDFFTPHRWSLLLSFISLSLEEDGEDITSQAIFGEREDIEALVVAKEDSVVACGVLSDIIMRMLSCDYEIEYMTEEGEDIGEGTEILRIRGRARHVLKAERVILNFLSHTFGIATYTRRFVKLLEGTGTTLLDTRKTLPGFRYLDKYSVRVGGGKNHRFSLDDMVMVKDNHIDRKGSIIAAVGSIREKYSSPPPIIVECRNIKEVHDAIACKVDRILLDNMDPEDIREAISFIPSSIETEISGGINLDNILDYASLGATYISVGGITKSAPPIDLSMKITER